MIYLFTSRILLVALLYQAALLSMEERELKKQTIKLTYGQCAMQGKRRSMEDASIIIDPFKRSKSNSALFAIFDGHGTPLVAQFGATHLAGNLRSIKGDPRTKLALGIPKLDKEMLSLGRASIEHGTCALVALIEENRLAVANVGDSRAILSRSGEADALTDDHKPDRPDELERIEAAGGKVEIVDGVARVCHLAISRALGDFYAKKHNYVMSTPEIHETVLMPGDDFLILACDGVFERNTITRQNAVDIVKKSLASNDNDPEIAAKDLVRAAYDQGSGDNISVIIVTFNYDSEQEKNTNS
jgi:protein phosphatase 1L